MITPTQMDLIGQLEEQYGPADRVLVSQASYIHQLPIVRMDWCKQSRHLFILPNGDRLVWSEVT